MAMIIRCAKLKAGWCGFLWMFLCAGSLSAAEYEVDGEIVQTIFTRGGGVQGFNRSEFTVFVKGCAWLVKATDPDENGVPCLARETACVNGAEVCEVDGPFDPQSVKPGMRALNVGTIYSNNFPVAKQDDFFIGHLWLMFASGCYFTNPSTGSLPLLFWAGHPPQAAKWELIKGLGSLPSNIMYLGEIGLATNATYEATGFTNAGTVRIPAGFVFEERIMLDYAPGLIAPGDSAPTYRVRKRAIAKVTAVRPVCSRSDLLPAAQGRTMVLDLRLPESQRPTPIPFYFTENGVRWLPVEEAKAFYNSGSVPARVSSKARWVFFASVLSISSVFLYFLIKLKPKRM
jgi:hypothetical protein